MISGPKPGAETSQLDMTYDAWNRQTKVVDHATSNTVAEYRYDGRNYRIAKLIPNGETNWDRTDYYYNESWQCLEERFGANQAKETIPTSAKIQWLWSVQYIDAPVVRWRDGNCDGDLDGGTQEGDNTLYYTNDANMNVTALVDASDGAVVERYSYDPYGQPSIFDASWTAVAWANSKQNEILFAGYRFDNESGLYNPRTRYDHPTFGRMSTRDGGYWDGMNQYQYVISNPVTHIDPFGNETAAIAPPLPKGFDGATTHVSEIAKEWQKQGSNFYAMVVKTDDGTFHALDNLTKGDGNLGVSFHMDFVPTKREKECCKSIDIIQMIRNVASGEPRYGTDWHYDEKNKPVQLGMAAQWSSNGWFIERSHYADTPFMTGSPEPTTKTGRYGESGSSCTGKPLEFQDSPSMGVDYSPKQWEELAAGKIKNIRWGQALFNCAICTQGAHTGKVYGCFYYGWTFYPPKERGGKYQFSAIPLQFFSRVPNTAQCTALGFLDTLAVVIMPRPPRPRKHLFGLGPAYDSPGAGGSTAHCTAA